MYAVCFAGFSNSGKTTLIEQVIPALQQHGLRISIIKHAHHGFDMDRPGKDSYRYRQAGACEVLVASDQRTALLRENTAPSEPQVHELIDRLASNADWVLVEGFKDCNLPKLEIWRAAGAGYEERSTLLCLKDTHIKAVVTSTAERLPSTLHLPVLDWKQPQSVAQWLMAHSALFSYHP
jgi:molybdopterin-guanine dinucleotide biosynthesis protein B